MTDNAAVWMCCRGCAACSMHGTWKVEAQLGDRPLALATVPQNSSIHLHCTDLLSFLLIWLLVTRTSRTHDSSTFGELLWCTSPCAFLGRGVNSDVLENRKRGLDQVRQIPVSCHFGSETWSFAMMQQMQHSEYFAFTMWYSGLSGATRFTIILLQLDREVARLPRLTMVRCEDVMDSWSSRCSQF